MYFKTRLYVYEIQFKSLPIKLVQQRLKIESASNYSLHFRNDNLHTSSLSKYLY